jgi:hypothetical protein
MGPSTAFRPVRPSTSPCKICPAGMANRESPHVVLEASWDQRLGRAASVPKHLRRRTRDADFPVVQREARHLVAETSNSSGCSGPGTWGPDSHAVPDRPVDPSRRRDSALAVARAGRSASSRGRCHGARGSLVTEGRSDRLCPRREHSDLRRGRQSLPRGSALPSGASFVGLVSRWEAAPIHSTELGGRHRLDVGDRR